MEPRTDYDGWSVAWICNCGVESKLKESVGSGVLMPLLAFS